MSNGNARYNIYLRTIRMLGDLDRIAESLRGIDLTQYAEKIDIARAFVLSINKALGELKSAPSRSRTSIKKMPRYPSLG